jgi:hypothetical protein
MVPDSARGAGQDGGVKDGCLVLQGRPLGAAAVDQLRALLAAPPAASRYRPLAAVSSDLGLAQCDGST